MAKTAAPSQLTLKPPTLHEIELEVVDGDIVIMRINRPDRMNSQTMRMFAEYAIVARALRDSHARALIVTGAGVRAFCAGFDLEEIDQIMHLGVRDYLKLQETAAFGLAAINQLPFPVIAAVHGPATGGGFGLALACDIRLAAPSAKFSAAFVRVGLSIGELGVSWHLSRLIGPGRAAEIGYTGRIVEADEALRIGLVNHIVPAEQLLDEAVQLARTISANSPGGIKLSKQALQRNFEIGSYASALELENRGQALLTRTSDMAEALTAFKGRRAPRFTGR
jgi:enoyl-CoA hydratase/carnithine racemase